MAVRDLDTRAVIALVGVPALFDALWLTIVRLDWPQISTSWNVAVVLVLTAGGVALVAMTWSRVGGYRAQRALRQWVHDGPEPAEIPLPVRLRYLRGHPANRAMLAWLYLALAVMWGCLGIVRVVRGDPDAFGAILVVAVWASCGVVFLVAGRRWGDRVEALIEGTNAQQEDPDHTRHVEGSDDARA